MVVLKRIPLFLAKKRGINVRFTHSHYHYPKAWLAIDTKFSWAQRPSLGSPRPPPFFYTPEKLKGSRLLLAFLTTVIIIIMMIAIGTEPLLTCYLVRYERGGSSSCTCCANSLRHRGEVVCVYRMRVTLTFFVSLSIESENFFSLHLMPNRVAWHQSWNFSILINNDKKGRHKARDKQSIYHFQNESHFVCMTIAFQNQ